MQAAPPDTGNPAQQSGDTPDRVAGAHLLGTLVETMAEGMLLLDTDGRIAACNRAAQEILGLDEADLLRRRTTDAAWQTIREDGSPFPASEYPGALVVASGQARRNVIIGMHRPDASLVWIRINAEPLFDRRGTVTGALVTFADVTELKHKELQLAELEARWRLALEAAGHGVWEWDIAADRCHFSARAVRLLGVAPNAAGYRLDEWASRIHDADRPVVRKAARACMAGELSAYHADFRVLAEDGSYAEIAARGKVVAHDTDGRPLRMIGTFTDVTESRRTEAALLESERRFFQMADASPMPIWVSGVDGAHTYVNQAWLTRTGRTLAEALGSGWRSVILPEDLPAVDQACARAMSARQAFSVEYRLLHTNGVYRRMFEQAGPRFDGKGEFLGYVGLCVDIEARYAAEREIAKLSRALDQAALAIVITDAAGRIEYANPHTCRTYGYSFEELRGQNPRLFKSKRTTPDTYAELWLTLRRGETWTGTLCNARRDGSEIWEAVTISPVRDETGTTTHYVALKEDITARLETSRRELALQRHLNHMERMQALGTLAAGVAHDFNNILVAILGFSELGEMQLRAGQSPQRVAGYLSEIRTAGERARALVKQLLAVGRSGPIRLANVDLAELAREVVALVAVSMPQQRIALTAADALPTVHADATQLHQVLMNLLLNARDAMQPGGTACVDIDTAEFVDEVTCSACGERFFGPHLQMAVTDDGNGIPEHARDRLFESFFTTKEVNQGTGMGLAVVDGIVHRHGGHLLVESPAPRGARFRVLLPLAVDMPDEALR